MGRPDWGVRASCRWLCQREPSSPRMPLTSSGSTMRARSCWGGSCSMPKASTSRRRTRFLTCSVASTASGWSGLLMSVIASRRGISLISLTISTASCRRVLATSSTASQRPPTPGLPRRMSRPTSRRALSISGIPGAVWRARWRCSMRGPSAWIHTAATCKAWRRRHPGPPWHRPVRTPSTCSMRRIGPRWRSAACSSNSALSSVSSRRCTRRTCGFGSDWRRPRVSRRATAASSASPASRASSACPASTSRCAVNAANTTT
mmetsp:Transcript_80338/g.247728  ORF Transcript_80338/g.247728 Transcript_80338/m.247728 type:complete len:262 (-) Transcript_80338:147-932(-)